jgi:hypothetical protein
VHGVERGARLLNSVLFLRASLFQRAQPGVGGFDRAASVCELGLDADALPELLV